MKLDITPGKLIPKLLIGVMIISAPIFAAVRAAAIGVDIADLWWPYVPLEIISGAALVLMEGGALYVVSSYWRQFKPFTVYWNILGGIMLVIALALPFIATSYFVSAQYSLKIYQVLTFDHIWNNFLVWAWSFSVACIPTILVIGLGIAHGVEHELPQGPVTVDRDALKTEAFGLLALAHKGGSLLHPPALAAMMKDRITTAEAARYISEWFEALPKRPGPRSAQERELLEAVGVSLNGYINEAEVTTNGKVK
jgi:hypothetical protein